jgi:hypothetical protein
MKNNYLIVFIVQHANDTCLARCALTLLRDILKHQRGSQWCFDTDTFICCLVDLGFDPEGLVGSYLDDFLVSCDQVPHDKTNTDRIVLTLELLVVSLEYRYIHCSIKARYC